MKRFHIVLLAGVAGCGNPTNGALQGYAEGEYLRVASPIAGQLARAKFISKEAVDTARSARDRDQGRVSELKAQLAAAKLAARPDEIRAASAAVAAAREALAQADWRLEQKSLRAPRDGRVTDTLYVQGEWVPAGSPVVTLLPPTSIKVRFFVQERILG